VLLDELLLVRLQITECGGAQVAAWHLALEVVDIGLVRELRRLGLVEEPQLGDRVVGVRYRARDDELLAGGHRGGRQ